MVGSYMNYFHTSYNDTLWKIDYLNLTMLSATIPNYDEDEDANGAEKQAAALNAGNKLKVNNFLDGNLGT